MYMTYYIGDFIKKISTNNQQKIYNLITKKFNKIYGYDFSI